MPCKPACCLTAARASISWALCPVRSSSGKKTSRLVRPDACKLHSTPLGLGHAAWLCSLCWQHTCWASVTGFMHTHQARIHDVRLSRCNLHLAFHSSDSFHYRRAHPYTHSRHHPHMFQAPNTSLASLTLPLVGTLSGYHVNKQSLSLTKLWTNVYSGPGTGLLAVAARNPAEHVHSPAKVWLNPCCACHVQQCTPSASCSCPLDTQSIRLHCCQTRCVSGTATHEA